VTAEKTQSPDRWPGRLSFQLNLRDEVRSSLAVRGVAGAVVSSLGMAHGDPAGRAGRHIVESIRTGRGGWDGFFCQDRARGEGAGDWKRGTSGAAR
jgi:hypothetical protein